MPHYVGDTLRFEVESQDWDGEPVEPGAGVDVTLSIYSAYDDIVEVDAAPMEFTNGVWLYDWATHADVNAGPYRAEARVIGDDGSRSVEVRSVVLAEVDPE